MDAGLPVLVIIKAVGCGYCEVLGHQLPNLMKQLAAKNIKLRTKEITLPNVRARLDPNAYPDGLNFFVQQFYPMLILIPGGDWDAAMAQGLGPGNKYELHRSASVFNGTLVKDKNRYEPNQERNLYQGGFLDWISATLATPAFRTPGIPSFHGSAPGFQPLFTATPPAASAPAPAPQSISPPAPAKKTDKGTGTLEFCSLRFVPRHK